MNIITGYRGEPHITSAQDRAGNQGSYGTASYVLNVGSKFSASVISANEIRISDGILSHQGCLAIIESGTYDSVSINNGAQGMNRIDRIVARYTKDSETNVESVELAVIQGTATASTPVAPAYNQGTIATGSTPVDMPLYQVRLTGITVSSVTAEFATVRTQKEMDTLLGNTSISGIGGGTVTGAISALNSKTIPISQGGTGGTELWSARRNLGITHETLGSGDDLNSLTGWDKAGLYYISTGVANSPATWCWMIVIGGAGSCQVIFESTKFYMRAYTGSPIAWGVWRKVDLAAV